MRKVASSQAGRRFSTQVFLCLEIALGIATFVAAIAGWHSVDPLRLLAFAIATALGAALKLRLPGLTGTVSASALFVLVATANVSLPEAIAVAALGMLVQCTWRTSAGPKPIHIAFNISVYVTAVLITSTVFQWSHRHLIEPVSFAILATAFYCANTFPLAAIIGLTENQPILKTWRAQRWLLPFYIVGASMAWVIGTFPRSIQWEFPLICLPLVYLVHRSNKTQITQMEHERAHMQAITKVHLRTIEALALAIDAKDHTTHDHLQRVQLYATEIGKDLGLSDSEMEALTAAAVLHDIGKLAVPESIISKPGKLTRAEFEKMKIHPVVGAEILERVEFPYPVVPIVRAHHERWDGNGYPYGLRGEQIPIGARILSAVDCLDALASDRQYRRALPLDEAMAKVASEAGAAFDPRVVQALQARYRELEERAKAMAHPVAPPLSVDVKITRGAAPATGFEAEGPAVESGDPAAHTQDPQSDLPLPDMPSAGVCTLLRDEAMAVAALRIQRVLSYDAIVICSLREDLLCVEFTGGNDRAEVASLDLHYGDGLLGWVAETGKPILNGNPTVELGFIAKTDAAPGLSSALAVPLVDAGHIVGVLALYRRQRDAFAAAESVTLLQLCPALASLLTGGALAADLMQFSNAIQLSGSHLVRT